MCPRSADSEPVAYPIHCWRSAALEIIGAEVLEPLSLVLLRGGGLDMTRAGQRLDQKSAQDTRRFAKIPRRGLEARPGIMPDQKLQRQQRGNEKRQPPGELQHHGRGGGERQYAADEGRRGIGAEALHLRDIPIQPAHQIADGDAGEPARRDAAADARTPRAAAKKALRRKPACRSPDARRPTGSRAPRHRASPRRRRPAGGIGARSDPWSMTMRVRSGCAADNAAISSARPNAAANAGRRGLRCGHSNPRMPAVSIVRV